MGARWLVFFKIKTADVSLRDLRATARFSRQAVVDVISKELPDYIAERRRSRSGEMGARWLVFFKIKTADVSLRDLRATARFSRQAVVDVISKELPDYIAERRRSRSGEMGAPSELNETFQVL